ncbi:MAG: Rne/Rng family ribonuclease [Epsilonproteobacteria bacterium]|nr:Rne/Rng family ribonuclease [Campylobacterota bacterium]
MKKIVISKDLFQTRVAILNGDQLQDIYFASTQEEDLERSFFKGRVSKVLPGIQTAFIDIGQPKAGFLHISEIDRFLATEKISEYLQVDDIQEEFSKQELKEAFNIQKIFQEGEDALVQVIKEPIGEKGAKLTTCFTLPGRFVVLMPNIPQIGISKKIEDKDERARLRDIITRNLHKGMGAIIRTTAEGRSEKDLTKDLAFITSTWHSVQKRYKKAQASDLVHKDLPSSLRAIRDHLDDDVELVITDNPNELQAIEKFTKHLTPEHTNKIRLYTGQTPLFEHLEIQKQIDKALQKKVQLKSGGSLVIETTEAMSVIDVNTGKFTGSNNMENTILKTNMEAAEEIVTQLRLRNIGGLIVIDFIDMASQSNRQKLSRYLEKNLKEKDRFQSVTLKVSEFGLVQMTRKRSGKTLAAQLTDECPCCHGNGRTKSVKAISIDILRQLKDEISQKRMQGTVTLHIAKNVLDYVVHNQYQAILQLEKTFNCKIQLHAQEQFELTRFDVERSDG